MGMSPQANPTLADSVRREEGSAYKHWEEERRGEEAASRPVFPNSNVCGNASRVLKTNCRNGMRGALGFLLEINRAK